MNAWVRSQPKTLRPYFGAQAAEGLLDEMELFLKFGDAPVQGNRLIVDDSQMKDMAPRLYPKLSEERINAVFGERRSAFDLVVTLRTPQMLRRELVKRFSLGEEARECIEVPQHMLKDAKLTGLFELGASICLSKEVDLGPGWPNHLGSWVAKEIYTIGLDRRQSAFRIEVLTKEMREQRALPDETLIWVDVDDLNEVYEAGTTCATAYVSERLHDRYKSGKTHSAVNALLYSEIVCAVLASPDNGLKESTFVAPGSPLENICEQLRPGEALNLKELKSFLDDPVRLRAFVHDSRGMAKELEKI
ncbi:hypothetical protein FHS89_001759 [Rubricella aquisinus]|uniref:Uncharacterized protein n=1 Tax=Rubricella aquisinus TaxID=2028108 RepID=A0A840WL02_9RHOB|nr:hypothetical protein [Rubricella aquisinus]MBB5515739.1 hypothetical protein [Rubricella aquisinus]